MSDKTSDGTRNPTQPTRKWSPEQVIPAIHVLMDRVLQETTLRDVHPEALKRMARDYTTYWRSEIRKIPDAPEREELIEKFPDYVRERLRPGYPPVINATGVILHTNLGRAPLSPEIFRRLRRILTGYAAVEYDLDKGERGERDRPLAEKLRLLLGCEDAVVVNNNAAAVLLILTALARGREVLVSRGELIEIGGKFRLPDVFAQSGARLIEVGTTNRTRLTDYIQACTDETVGVLRTHPSNYRIIGFTERPRLTELTRWAHERGLQVWKDLGSGLMDVPDLMEILADEPTVRQSLERGCDLVCFSGDKILGGPQAGIIVGKSTYCAQLRRHPLYRALRVDKYTLGFLDGVFSMFLRPRRLDRHRVLKIVRQEANQVRQRCLRVARKLMPELPRGVHLSVVPDTAVIGGGLAPTVKLSSWSLMFSDLNAPVFAAELRRQPVPIIGRIEDDRFYLNLHTVLPPQIRLFYREILQAFAGYTGRQ